MSVGLFSHFVRHLLIFSAKYDFDGSDPHDETAAIRFGRKMLESLKPLVRVIDDDDAMRRSWAFLIEGEGWDVVTYSDALDFIASNDVQRPGCLVLDVRMPRMSGLELQDKMQELGIDLPIIFISGHGDIDMAVRTLKQGAVDFLQKPVDDQRRLTASGYAVM